MFKKRLSFTRAASEPPSANKNAVVPVQENSNDGSSEEKGNVNQEIVINDQENDEAKDEPKLPPLLGNLGSSQYFNLGQ